MNRKTKKIGLLIAILGIVGIIISQTADFRFTKQVVEHNNWGIGLPDVTYNQSYYNQDLKNGFLYGGIIVLILGSGIALFNNSDQDEQ